MNGCNEVQAGFTEYLDGRLNGREMQEIDAHLEACRKCAREWQSLRDCAILAGRAGPGAGAGRPAAADSCRGEPGDGRAAAVTFSQFGNWPGKTPWDRSCCRPAPDLPARCCCWAPSSCF